MLKNNKRQFIAILSLSAIGLAAAPFWSWLTFLVTVSLLSCVAILRIGILARVAGAIFFVSIAGAIAMQVTTLLGVDLNFTVVHVLLLIFAGWYAFSSRNKITLKTSYLDALGFLVWLAVFLVIALPLFGASSSKTLESLIKGEDNSSHLQIYRYVLEEKQYAFNNSPEDTGIRPSLLSYAQGSHAAMATVTAPFVENASPLLQLKAYVYIAAGVYATIFWFAFLVIAKPLQALKDLRARYFSAGALGLVYVVYVPLGVFLGLYNYAHYPQNVAYLGLVFLLLIVTSSESKDKKPMPGRRFMVEITLLLTGVYAVFASWYLLTPVVVPILLAYLWANHQELLAKKWKLALFILPIALLCAYLAYIYLIKSTGVGHILTPGGVFRMKGRVLLLCIPAIFVGFNMWRRKQWHLVGLAVSLIVASVMTLLVGLYQVKKIQHFDYYFYKLLFTVLMLSVVYYGHIFVQSLASKLSELKPLAFRGHAIIWPTIGVLAVAFTLFSFNLPKSLSTFLNNYQIPQAEPGRLLDVFANEAIYEQYSDVITLSSCNAYTNFTGTIWAGSFFLPYNTLRGELEGNLLARSNELSLTASPLLTELAQYAVGKDKPVAVVLGEIYCRNEASDNIIQELKTAKNIRFVDVHGNPIQSGLFK